MSIVSAIVIYAVYWFMIFLIVIPIRLQTQGDVGEIVPGTHAGAPEVHNLGKKAWLTTAIAFVLWAITVAVIVSGVITLEMIDLRGRLSGG